MQIWCSPMSGGEPVQVSSFPVDVQSFRMFSGFGNRIWAVCCFSVYASMSLEETMAEDARIAATGSTGMVFDSLMARHWYEQIFEYCDNLCHE